MLARLTAYLRAFARRRRDRCRSRRRDCSFTWNSKIETNIGRGMSPVEARRVALRDLGGLTQTREAVREIRTTWLDSVWYDARHAVRSLRRRPVFTAVALLTLALGIGANTAIFSIVNGVLLQPLDYPRPAQLMYLTTNGPSAVPGRVAEYLEFQQFNRSFAEVGAFRTGEANLMAGDRALRVRSAIVDSHLLNALGVQPAQGRLFTREDSVVSAPALPGGGAVTVPVALISYELWRSAFGAQPIVGHSVDVDGRRLQVVGVLARGADLMDNHTEIWLPLGFTDAERQARNNHNLTLIGRLKEDVTPASAQTELNALIETWSARTGITPGDGHAGHVFQPLAKGSGGHILQMTPLTDQILGRAGQSIWVLQAAVGLVLLIACANVANLLLARAETRRREFAVLTALGAGRGRLLRKALTESMILAVAGGALGVLLARTGVEALVRAYPASLPRMSEVTVDPRVMLVSLAVAVVCGLLFGLAPMMHTRSDATAEALKSGPRGSSGTTRHHVRRALVIAETALAVIVVVGAGLLLRTVQNLTAVDVGFDRSRLVTFSITLPRSQLRPHGPRPRLSEDSSSSCAPCLASDGDGDDRLAARSPGPAQPDGDHERRRRPGRLSGDRLPTRDVRLFRDDGHPDPAGPRLSVDRCRVGGRGRRRQRDDGQHVLERAEPDRAAAAPCFDETVVHGDRRRQGRQAEWCRSAGGRGGLCCSSTSSRPTLQRAGCPSHRRRCTWW